jgi:hypothetical protein
MYQPEAKDCSLRLAVQGQAEVCPHERCAFWEPGGAVVAGACLIERLSIDLGRRDLAAYLLDTRERLEQARELAHAEAAHREFARRLGCDA